MPDTIHKFEFSILGVGPRVTQEVLNGIANQPSSRYTFQVDEFRQLETILLQVASAACQTNPPPVIPPPG